MVLSSKKIPKIHKDMIDGPSILLDQETNAEAEVDLVAEADKVFDSWMNFSPKVNAFLVEGATPTVTNRITGRVTFRV